MNRQAWNDVKQTARDEAAALDHFITKWLEERAASGRRIFCSPGCSGCCTLFVQSTLGEALRVAEGLDSAQLSRLEEYVRRQQEIFSGSADFLAVLRKQRSTLGPCPFLDAAGCCSIYALRPLACRALLSTKSGEWCEVDFATLPPLEKRLYLESLERETVAFPVHYVAVTQDAAKEAEGRILEQMQTHCEGAISGNFPLLVYLAATLDTDGAIAGGVAHWSSQLKISRFYNPLLIQLPAEKE